MGRRGQERERELKRDVRRVGYRSEAGTRVRGREDGRVGGGEGKVWARRAQRSACSFQGMLTWAGTQQMLTVF